MKIIEVINKLKENPDNILAELDQENLDKIIKYLYNRYNNHNESLVSDNLFDYIKEYYEKKYNKIKEVGAPIEGDKNKKVKLPNYMGSLDKIKPSTTEFEKWINKYKGSYIISYKLDGISSLIHKSNNIIKMYTRGNGIYGQDISHVLKYININTDNIKNGDSIRGELIISKKNFKKIEETMANSRNAVCGIINTKKPDPDLLKLVDFIAYWVIEPELKQSEQMKYIEKAKMKVVDYVEKKNITIDFLSEMLIKGRKDYSYDIDGIVVIDNSKINVQLEGENPEYGFAFKQILTDQIAETTVIDVLWELSKDKYLKPKIKIDTVELLGSEITYATAFNAKFIVDNVIGPGSVIKIIKSGDVIPYIQEVLKVSDTGKPKMPSEKFGKWEWNDTKVDIIAIDLDEDNMKKLITKKLSYFFATLDIKYMGESTVEKFVENNYNDLWKIIIAKDNDYNNLCKIPGLGQKSVDKIYVSIEEGLINRELSDLMSASQIFGRGVGSRKLKLITDLYPNIIEIYNKEGKDHVFKLINNINGFDDKTTTKIVDNMKEFQEWLGKLLKLKKNVLKNQNSNNLNNDDLQKYNNNIKNYSNITIVFTGFRDKDIEIILEKLNSKITNSISKNTNLLIATNPHEKSSKIEKAKELKIKIISKEDFYNDITK